MPQVFIINDSCNAQLCYSTNVQIDKVVETFQSNIYDNVENKRYINVDQLNDLTTVFDQLSITWSNSDNVTVVSVTNVNKYLAKHTIKSKTVSNPHFFHFDRLHEIHKSRRNTIRIVRQLDMIRVELPMSLYSFHALNPLKKSYSLDAYAWNFIGEEAIENLFATCVLNKIGIIQEVEHQSEMVLTPKFLV
jgi:hypothetical protein